LKTYSASLAALGEDAHLIRNQVQIA